MKKQLFFIFFFLFLISCSDNFQKLPEKYLDDENLLKQIIPNSKVEYWQIDYINGFSPEKIFAKGNSNLVMKIEFKEPNNLNGFFTGCQPMHCDYRILYIENQQWKFITNENELKEFIGKIDNEYEAVLIARINDYNIDYNSNGNGFEKKDYGYNLKVMKYNSCPETKESFIVSVNIDGTIKRTKNLGYYLKTNNCIKY